MTTHFAFTDGAAKGNPGPGGWGAIAVSLDGHVTELGGGSAHTTNNRMELSGAIGALEHFARLPGTVAIYTDSTYVIQGITKWVWNWRRRGWKTADGGDVLNQELWERLSSLVSARGAGEIVWHWVKGHVGTPGNERVDEIAVAFALQQPAHLYDGPLAAYGLDIFRLPDDTSLPSTPSRSAVPSKPSRSAVPGLPSRSAVTGTPRAKAGAFSYLSVVDGEAMRHTTWSDCERRVKGRSGARFKKSASAADEAAILRAWGVDPGSL